MNTTPKQLPPKCPGCGGRHYPATRGDGRAVWCNGIAFRGPVQYAPALDDPKARPTVPTNSHHLSTLTTD